MTTIDSTKQLVDLIRSESERVKELVRALPSNALENRSPCERWAVGDVIAHLIWFAEKYGGMMERGLQGDQSPPEGFPVVPGTMKGPAIAKLYGDSAIELRRGLGEGLIPEFCERYDWLNNLLDHVSPDEWNMPCYHTLRVRPVESFVPVIVAELAVHEWDIRSTIEPSPSVSGASIPALLIKLPSNRVPWSLPYVTKSGPKLFRFEFMNLGDRRDIIVEDGKARMEHSSEESADLTLSGNASTFVLLIYGRLTVASALAADLFTAEGDLGLVPDFDRWLRGN